MQEENQEETRFLGMESPPRPPNMRGENANGINFNFSGELGMAKGFGFLPGEYFYKYGMLPKNLCQTTDVPAEKSNRSFKAIALKLGKQLAPEIAVIKDFKEKKLTSQPKATF